MADPAPTPTPGAVAGASPTVANLPERIAREHLRLARRQIGRIPLANGLIELFLCWLVLRLGHPSLALLWFAALFGTQLARWHFVRQLRQGAPGDPQALLRRLTTFLLLIGALRAAMVPLVFLHPPQIEHFMLTMVYVGLVAGTGASVGGEVRPFLAYAGLVGGSLALAWALQGGTDGAWVSALIVLLILVLAANLRDQRDGLHQFVKLACDNEQLAESLRLARDAAEAASLSKTRFFAAASHDLRQPLHALSINATTLELLASRQTDPLIKELSNSINRALGQSNALLDSLLEISKLDAGAVKPQTRSVDLAQLLAGVREEFAALAAQKGLQLLIELPHLHVLHDRQGQPAAPLLAATDPQLLRRILSNLVGNALKFTHTGRVTLSVQRLGPGPHAGWLGLAVTDTGPGIAAAEQSRVFEEFYQLDNTGRDRNQGLGLGLAIVQRTAALLGAPLRLSSTPGQGTTVALSLPPSAADAPPPDDLGRLGPVQPGMLAGLRVLLVDDELEIQRSLQGLLTQLGCTARCVSDLAQAVAQLDAGFAPQVLLIDHRLRGERGTEVIASLQARLGPVPAVLVTGDTEPALIQAARAAGHRVLHKPVQGHLLASLLQELASGGAAPGLQAAGPGAQPA